MSHLDPHPICETPHQLALKASYREAQKQTARNTQNDRHCRSHKHSEYCIVERKGNGAKNSNERHKKQII